MQKIFFAITVPASISVAMFPVLAADLRTGKNQQDCQGCYYNNVCYGIGRGPIINHCQFICTNSIDGYGFSPVLPNPYCPQPQ
jgi:hypothetical protein